MISLKNTLKAITNMLNDVPHYTLLWTNPNPTSSFSAQTISLDLSKYDAIAVVFDRYGGVDVRSTQMILEKNEKFTLGTTTDERLRYRACSFNDKGVTFDTPQMFTTYGIWGSRTSTDEYVNVPIKIYGIKFGGV